MTPTRPREPHTVFPIRIHSIAVLTSLHDLARGVLLRFLPLELWQLNESGHFAKAKLFARKRSSQRQTLVALPMTTECLGSCTPPTVAEISRYTFSVRQRAARLRIANSRSATDKIRPQSQC